MLFLMLVIGRMRNQCFFRLFTNQMGRPFVVRYNPYTESVEALNTKSASSAMNILRADVNLKANEL